MEINVYNPRSRMAYVLHTVFLICLVAQHEYAQAFWIGIASLVLALILSVIAFRKAKRDTSYRRVFRLKILENALARGFLRRIKYTNITDVSFKHEQLKISTRGRSYHYNVCENQLEKIVQLKNQIAKFKDSEEALRNPSGYKVTYSGTEMTIDLMTSAISLDGLLDSIRRIQKMVVIDKINLCSPEGSTEVISGEDVDNIDQVMSGRLEC